MPKRLSNEPWQKLKLGRCLAPVFFLILVSLQDQRIRIYNVDKNWALQKDVLARNLRWTVTETALSPDHRFLVTELLSL